MCIICVALLYQSVHFLIRFSVLIPYLIFVFLKKNLDCELASVALKAKTDFVVWVQMHFDTIYSIQNASNRRILCIYCMKIIATTFLSIFEISFWSPLSDPSG